MTTLQKRSLELFEASFFPALFPGFTHQAPRSLTNGNAPTLTLPRREREQLKDPGRFGCNSSEMRGNEHLTAGDEGV